MNEGEIAERFIRAAETDRRRKVHGAWPQQFGSSMPAYKHSMADKAGWRKVPGDNLRPEDWDAESRRNAEPTVVRPSSADISDLEECERWMGSLVTDEGERRALWAWAHSKAGGPTFSSWCFRTENIHPETGRRRKDRAVSRISCELHGKPMQNNEMQVSGVLADDPENAYVEATFGQSRQDEPAGEKLADLFVMYADQRDFSWAEKRNERRRQQRQRKQRGAEAA